MGRQRKFWGWGYADQTDDAMQQVMVDYVVQHHFPGADLTPDPEPRLDDLDLRAPRLTVPAPLAGICTTDPYERAAHTYGKSFRDVVRGARGEFDAPPDLVALPRTEGDVVALLDWCTDANAAAIPYGGGSSVVGGVEPGAVDDSYAGVVTIDLRELDQVIEIDKMSRAARIQAGIFGPALEDALRPHGLTLRHFPQSFEFSTLGGWIATRSGGHYATLYTHIEDFVESLRCVTPTGILESRRLPGSGAGPSPDRLLAGSEGTLGIITEAWMRLQDRPVYRASAPVRFPGEDGFLRGAEAARQLAQSGLYPTNCRLLDAAEAANSGAGTGEHAILVLGFESADHPLDPWMARALECCRDAGGEADEDAGQTRTDAAATRGGAAGAWRKAFLQAPYMRDTLIRMGIVCETFETAIPWSAFEAFYHEVMEAGRAAIKGVCGQGDMTCRFTHLYPDGPAPYFTIFAEGKKGSQIEQWDEIKQAAAEAVLSNGGTITHHHAVGRDHRPWYDRQRPEPFARALRAAKAELDPAGILNPGVLLDPRTS